MFSFETNAVIDLVAGAIASRWPELIVASLFGVLSWFGTRVRTRMRIGRRIAHELVETQHALWHRADPAEGWKETADRHDWMLEPYTRRVDFLSSLAEAEGLSQNVVEAIAAYHNRMRFFISVWSKAKRRRDDFNKAYDETVTALESALSDLGRLARYRRRIDEFRRAPSSDDQPDPAAD